MATFKVRSYLGRAMNARPNLKAFVTIEPLPGYDFFGGDFFGPRLLGNFSAHMGKSSDSEETKNATTVVINPAPQGDLFLTKTPGIV